MKKVNLLSLKIYGCIAVSLIVLLFFACQKDDTMQPGSVSANVTEKIASVNPVALSYEIIKINHVSPRGVMPDYEVDLYTDLNVRFVGRRNTFVLGEKFFKTDQVTFDYLKSLYVSSHLFDTGPDAASTAPANGIADEPIVFTSFNNGMQVVTLSDNNSGIPKNLYELRIRTEEILGISSLVNPKGNNL